MIEKYKTVKQDVFEYVRNRVKLGIKPGNIAAEVEHRFPTFIAFFKCDPEMINEFIQWLIEQAYYYEHNAFYGQSTGKAPE